MAFPDAQGEWEGEPAFQLSAKEVTNIFDRRIFEEVVQGPVIIVAKDIAENLLQVGEIDHHAAFEFALNAQLDLVRVTVKSSAFGVAGKKMGAIHVLGHAKPHGVRIAHAA